MKWPWNRLPEVPTGFEVLDLLWSQMVPMASEFLDALPKSVDPAWATQQGVFSLATDLMACEAAHAELQRTRKHAVTLRRVRARRLRLLQQQYQTRALTFVGALAEKARREHAKASAAQLLMVVQNEFRELLAALSRDASTWVTADKRAP